MATFFYYKIQEYPNGAVKLVVERETTDGDPGSGEREILGARGIPAALAADTAYIDNLKEVARKEFLAALQPQYTEREV